LPLLLLATAAAAAPGEGVRPVFVEEVPYVTTPDSVTAAMLELAAVKAGDHVIDLGSGDGRIVIAAALRGATGLGVEIDPGLVAESIANAGRAGVAGRARFLEQDLFKTDLAPATVVTMYLLPEVNLQLRPAILALRPGTRIVSHDWDMGDWKPDRSVTLAVPEKSIGLAKTSRVHLWVVPARVDGLWCGVAPGGAAALRLRQSHQFAQGEIRIGGASPARVSGRIDGAVLALGEPQSPAVARLRLALRETGAQTTEASGEFTTLQGIAWRRARGDDCRAN
jgi:SAM-dependent methyltransferase